MAVKSGLPKDDGEDCEYKIGRSEDDDDDDDEEAEVEGKVGDDELEDEEDKDGYGDVCDLS